MVFLGTWHVVVALILWQCQARCVLVALKWPTAFILHKASSVSWAQACRGYVPISLPFLQKRRWDGRRGRCTRSRQNACCFRTETQKRSKDKGHQEKAEEQPKREKETHRLKWYYRQRAFCPTKPLCSVSFFPSSLVLFSHISHSRSLFIPVACAREAADLTKASFFFV